MKKVLAKRQHGYMESVQDFYSKQLEFNASQLEEARKNNAILARIALALERVDAARNGPEI